LTYCPRTWELAQRLLVSPAPADPAAPAPSGGNSAAAAEIEAVAQQIRAEHCPDTGGFAAGGSPDRLLRQGLLLAQFAARPAGPARLRRAADARRRQLVGDTVTYVVNRNLNPGNRCVLRCGFCAFRRDEGEPGHFRLSRPLLLERAAEAQAAGATELCVQAGLDPLARLEGSALGHAELLLRDLHTAAPGIHLHAFSPQELVFIAEQDQISLDRVLGRLQEAGLGSVPGTAAEVLSDRVRRLICPEKLSAVAWVAAMLQVHARGLASTATLMAGHLESEAERVAHLLTLAAIQRHARSENRVGFTEFVLLPFVGANAPPSLRARVARDQPDPRAMLQLTARARLLLDHWLVHHQPSWVKLTLPVAAAALRWGCDDLGGTLMEEHITSMAGARGGSGQSPEALRRAAQGLGRAVRQRTTLYGMVPSSP
jgi:FO synthase subunit 2